MSFQFSTFKEPDRIRHNMTLDSQKMESYHKKLLELDKSPSNSETLVKPTLPNLNIGGTPVVDKADDLARDSEDPNDRSVTESSKLFDAEP